MKIIFQPLFRVKILDGWQCELTISITMAGHIYKADCYRGFGDRMVGTPAVVVWPNSDNTISLAQVSFYNDNYYMYIVTTP
jgi:hypothetical protein